jgi:glycerate 2-kinase
MRRRGGGGASSVSRAGHVVVAPDKFKGSLTAPQVAAHVAAGLQRFMPTADVRLAPVADGGDGTLEAVAACGYSLVPVVVSGPTGQPVDAAFARRGGTAVVELAEASGLRRLSYGRLDAMHASSRGTGELMRAALDADCDQIIVGLGGSACTDGGAGMLQALGLRLLDRQGRELGPGGAALQALHAVDLEGLDPRLIGARIVLASDVDNPLLGPKGAAAVYSPQKGATVAEVALLDNALRRWAEVLAEATREDMSRRPGAGAAGGVGFAALAVLDAELQPGIELILDLIEFDELLPGARLVITGEGSLDQQSLHGKAPVGVAAAAARHGSPTIAVAGRCSLSAEEVQAGGMRAAYALTSLEPDSSVCIREAGRLLEELAASVVAPEWLGGRTGKSLRDRREE